MASHQTNTYLNSFINYEIDRKHLSPSILKPDRIKFLLKLLGNPQEHMNFIHVAGTKGKGSVCAFTASILKHAGYKVGLYTSPHLYDLNERIRILSLENAGECCDGLFPDSISDEALDLLLEEIKPSLEQARETKEYGCLSYFEVMTAIAFCFFKKNNADYVVLEVGMGGRLDATNVVESLLCAITPISLEHTKELGNTVELIAKEKAAIIKKNNRHVVCAPQEDGALDVIKNKCDEFNADMILVGEQIKYECLDNSVDGQSFSVKGIKDEYRLDTTLIGEHQVINAATSIGLIEILKDLGANISTEAVKKGVSRTFWPGRCEILQREPIVICDSAHNEDSASKLSDVMKKFFSGENIVLVVGLSDDKDKEGICKHLTSIAKEVILTKADHPRSCSFSDQEIKECLGEKKYFKKDKVSDAVELAIGKAETDDIILITGSVFVVAEARKIILNRCKTT